MTWFEVLAIGALVSSGAWVVGSALLGIKALFNPDASRRREAWSELYAFVRSTTKIWLPLGLWIGFVAWLMWNASRP